ncbi:MAG: hypothetical protein ACYSR4_11220 [Planctomycetota bacterium]
MDGRAVMTMVLLVLCFAISPEITGPVWRGHIFWDRSSRGLWRAWTC